VDVEELVTVPIAYDRSVTVRARGRVAFASFQQLCVDALGAGDYTSLALRFPTGALTAA
jgi:predicted ATPase